MKIAEEELSEPSSTYDTNSTSPEQQQRRFNALAQQYIAAILNSNAGAELDSRFQNFLSEASDILACTYVNEDYDESDDEEDEDDDEDTNGKKDDETAAYQDAERLTYLLRSWNTGRRGPGDCRRKCSIVTSQQQQQQQDTQQVQQYQHSSYTAANSSSANDEADDNVLYVPNTVPSLQPTPSMSTNHIVIMAVALFIVPMVVSVVVGFIISRRSKWRKDEIGGEKKGDDAGKGGAQRGKSEVDPLTVSDSLPHPGADEYDDIELTPTSTTASPTEPTTTAITTEQTNLLEADDVQIREEEIGDLQM